MHIVSGYLIYTSHWPDLVQPVSDLHATSFICSSKHLFWTNTKSSRKFTLPQF